MQAPSCKPKRAAVRTGGMTLSFLAGRHRVTFVAATAVLLAACSSVLVPFLLPSTVAANMFQWLFTQGIGLINETFGLDTPWLTDKSYAMLAIVIETLWWTVGFSFLLYLAALQGIPGHLYEAAKLDGANAWHRMVHITLPMLRHIPGLVIALQILASLQLFDQAVVMMDFGPGPEVSTRSFVQYTLEQGFTSYRVGYASAMSIIFFVIIAVVALARMWLLRTREEGAR